MGCTNSNLDFTHYVISDQSEVADFDKSSFEFEISSRQNWQLEMINLDFLKPSSNRGGATQNLVKPPSGR